MSFSIVDFSSWLGQYIVRPKVLVIGQVGILWDQRC